LILPPNGRYKGQEMHALRRSRASGRDFFVLPIAIEA